MELKHWMNVASIYEDPLLIVPYGIETYYITNLKLWNYLLIVPYGIETAVLWPYGGARMGLLIVPYGIETKAVTGYSQSTDTFNRTLWN